MMNKFGSELGDFLEFYNISKKEFAYRIGTTPKNLIDIINGKIELTQNMIYNISMVTDIPISYIENIEFNNKVDNGIINFLKERNESVKDYLKNFKYKEARSKYGITIQDERDDINILRDLMKYLRITDLHQLYMEDNSIFYKSKNDKKELLALWLERCYRLTFNQKIETYSKDNIKSLVEFIQQEAKLLRFDENKLIEMFNNKGIYLVIEDDLPGSKIRGAFKVLNDKPAIFITRKHRRIADIYFALLHELAHCKSDFNRAKSGCIVSYDDIESVDYEVNADKQALNWMLDDKEYQKLKSNINLYDNGEYIKCFAVYRLAYDKIIGYNSKLYQEYNSLINLE